MGSALSPSPPTPTPRILQAAAVVNSALDLYFPEGCGVEVVAELGRYYVDSAFTLVVNVVAKKEVPLDQPGSEGKRSVGGREGFGAGCAQRPERFLQAAPSAWENPFLLPPPPPF